MSNSTDSFSPVSSTERFTGRVKWFNNKAGYGFVTMTDGRYSGKDVFVHHSSIKVDSEQYKYLVQGEYIEFSLRTTDGTNNHEHQAGEVSGINGGKLMCETRRETRTSRTHHNEDSVTLKPRSVRVRGSGPREEGEWKYSSSSRPTESSQRDTTGRGSARGRGSRGRGATRSSTSEQVSTQV